MDDFNVGKKAVLHGRTFQITVSDHLIDQCGQCAAICTLDICRTPKCAIISWEGFIQSRVGAWERG